MASALDPTQAGAAAIINDQLAQWGIQSLAPDVLKLLKQGLDQNAIMIELQNTDAYKKRFAANEARMKAGLRVLSPAEYVASETQLKTLARQYLPPGFFGSKEDTDKLLAADVSPVEFQNRLQVAQQWWVTGDPETKQAAKDYFGISTPQQGIAAVLDPKKTEGMITQQMLMSQIGGAAIHQGLQVDASRAQQLAQQGITQQQAQQGYAGVAGALPADSAIAQRFGSGLTQTDEEDARLLGLASAQRKIKTLQSSEQSLFAGDKSAAAGGLSRTGSY